jgi:hypothetical protein
MKLNLLGFRLGLTRSRRSGAPTSALSDHRGRATLGTTLFATLLALIAAPLAASAASSATATINVAPPPVKSVTVSPTTLTYASCGSGNSGTASQLPFPSGECNTQSYSVTNSGNVSEQISVQGADAVSSGTGTHTNWTLCSSFSGDQSPPPACTGVGALSGNFPGQNQFEEEVNSSPVFIELSNSPQCDLSFGARSGTTCASAAANASRSPWLQMIGPASSTDPSLTFTTTVTYTAS